MSFEITTASPNDIRLSIYMEGESGAGKTLGALLIARGLAGPNGKIGVIDTERKRSLTYWKDEEIGGFEHMDFPPPYSPERFIEAMETADRAGWDVIIVDSASLEHDGEGGILDMAEAEGERVGQSVAKWQFPKHEHKRFLASINNLNCHVIMCFRVVPSIDMKTKNMVMTPVTEKTTKFAFELHASIDLEHKANWTRVPRPYRPAIANNELITVETGRILADLHRSNNGTNSQPAKQPDPQAGDTSPIIKIDKLCKDAGISRDRLNAVLTKLYGRNMIVDQLKPEALAKLATPEGFESIKASI